MTDYSAINAAAKSGASTGLSLNQRQEASRSSLADSEQTFLALMTAQLKNQDPLSPVDSNQFTQQIVQMTGVEQQLLTNDLLKALVGMNDGGLAGQVDMIGKEATTTSATGALADKSLSFDYTLGKPASSVKLEVVNAAGRTVRTIDSKDLTSGAHSYKWDGKNDAGEQLADGGIYSLKATAADLSGTAFAVSPTATSKGIVTAVSLENGVQMVTVNGRKIPASEIINVAAVAAPTTPATTTADNSASTGNSAAANTDNTSQTQDEAA